MTEEQIKFDLAYTRFCELNNKARKFDDKINKSQLEVKLSFWLLWTISVIDVWISKVGVWQVLLLLCIIIALVNAILQFISSRYHLKAIEVMIKADKK